MFHAPRSYTILLNFCNTLEFSTRDVDAIVFNVHLMQTGFSGSVLDSDGAVLVVCDVRLGNLA